MEKSESKMNKEIRRWRTFRQRGVFVGAFMLVLTVFIMAGTSRADRMRPAPIKKSKTQNNDVRRQRTDGNIVFCVPKGFICKDSVFAGCRLFLLLGESETEVTLNSALTVMTRPNTLIPSTEIWVVKKWKDMSQLSLQM